MTCELASLRGPGARYVAMGPVAGGNRQEIATQDSESETTATQSLVKQAVAVDTTPPALQVIEAVTASGPVVSIEGQVNDQSPIAELSVQGVPVPLGRRWQVYHPSRCAGGRERDYRCGGRCLGQCSGATCQG